jgi:hypothetical protein
MYVSFIGECIEMTGGLILQYTVGFAFAKLTNFVRAIAESESANKSTSASAFLFIGVTICVS